MTRLSLLAPALLLLVGCEQQSKTVVGGVKGTEVTRVCTRAYGSTEAKVAELMKKHGLTERPPMATKEDFVATCEQLPLETAKCLDPVWATADPEGCKAEQEKLSPELKEKLEGILQAAAEPTEEPPAEGEAAEGAEGEAAEGAEGEAPAEGEAAPAAPAPE
jgi:hypothetical protein